MNNEDTLTLMPCIIDCDADPVPRKRINVEDHKKGGQLSFDPSKVVLHLSGLQKRGKAIGGWEFFKELASMPVLNVNVLDFLLANPHLIPDEWKYAENGQARVIFFYGTTYRNMYNGLCVESLWWNEHNWINGGDWVGRLVHSNEAAALYIS